MTLAVAGHASPIGVDGDTGHALEYGMNPGPVKWSSREIVFADAMTRGAEFGRVTGGTVGVNNAPTTGAGLVGEGWPDFIRG